MSDLRIEDLPRFVEDLTSPTRCPWSGTEQLLLEPNTKLRLKALFKHLAAAGGRGGGDSATEERMATGRRFVELLAERSFARCSKTRWMLFQMIEYLTTRCSLFRRLFFDALSLWYLANLCGIDPAPLPAPKALAADLSARAIASLRAWHAKWAPFHIRLELAARSLARALTTRYTDVRASAERRESARLARLRRQQQAALARCQAMQANAPAFVAEVRRVLREAKRALRILLPPVEEEEAPVPAPSGSDARPSASELFTSYGLGGASYELQITIGGSSSLLEETPATTPLFDVLRDALRQLSSAFLPTIRGWEALLAKYQPAPRSPADASKREWSALLASLRTQLIDLQNRCSLLRFLNDPRPSRPARQIAATPSRTTSAAPSAPTSSSRPASLSGLPLVLQTLNASSTSYAEVMPSIFDILEAERERERKEEESSDQEVSSFSHRARFTVGEEEEEGGEPLEDGDDVVLDDGDDDENVGELEPEQAQEEWKPAEADQLDSSDLLFLQMLHPSEIVAQFQLQPPPSMWS